MPPKPLPGALATIPPAPLALGLGGLLPFWGLALALLMPDVGGFAPAQLAVALSAYAAVILSFLGGIRWGLAMRDGAAALPYVVSIVPSIVGWAALAAPEPWRLGVLAVAFLALGPLDLQLVRDGSAPAWFGRLRLILSTGAGVALALAAVAIRTAG